jgi:gamma-glutamylcysteine synthetase
MAQAASLKGLAGQTDFGPMIDLAEELVRLADGGLKRRAKASPTEKDERVYLAPLQSLVHMGASQAELLVKRFGDDAEAARGFAAADLWGFPW